MKEVLDFCTYWMSHAWGVPTLPNSALQHWLATICGFSNNLLHSHVMIDMTDTAIYGNLCVSESILIQLCTQTSAQMSLVSIYKVTQVVQNVKYSTKSKTYLKIVQYLSTYTLFYTIALWSIAVGWELWNSKSLSPKLLLMHLGCGPTGRQAFTTGEESVHVSNKLPHNAASSRETRCMNQRGFDNVRL